MERPMACDLVFELNRSLRCDSSDNIFPTLSKNISEVLKNPDVNINNLDFTNLSRNIVNEYLVLNNFFLEEIKTSLMASDDALNVLSLQQSKMVRESLREFVMLGLRFNLQPNLPQRIKPKARDYRNEEKTLTTDYDRLCFTTKCLISMLPCDVLRPIVALVSFEAIMNALYQIIYCPLKKPGNTVSENQITPEIYQKFQEDKINFQKLLKTCEGIIPRTIFVKETMLLLKSNCLWLRKAAGRNLTEIFKSQNGVRVIANVLLEETRDYDINDTTKSWQTIDIIAKLVVSLKNAEDFPRTCKDLLKLGMDTKVDGAGERGRIIYERIIASCVRSLYNEDQELCRGRLLRPILGVLWYLGGETAQGNKYADGEDVTDEVQRALRLAKRMFVKEAAREDEAIDKEFLGIVKGLFHLYRLYLEKKKEEEDVLEKICKDVQEIVQNFLKNVKICKDQDEMSQENTKMDLFLDVFLPTTTKEDKPQKNATLKFKNNKILVSLTSETTYDNFIFVQTFFALLQTPVPGPSQVSPIFKMKFLLRLLNLLSQFTGVSSSAESSPKDLETISKNLQVYNMLSSLASDPEVQTTICDEPQEFIGYAAGKLSAAVERGVHRGEDCEAPAFRATFLLVTIMQTLATTSMSTLTPAAVAKVAPCREKMLEPLRAMREEALNEELRNLVASLIDVFEGRADRNNAGGNEERSATSELEKILEDICDPLLPVRAHGLAALGKLVEEKHPQVMGKKIFVLNIFHENVKSDDSFIYLSAIKGLATMADMFPDTVLEILADEYCGLDQSPDGLETRMKLGEVLIKVSRNLGDRAPKYKSLLLNAFMLGAKDDDHLLRASSLSNLGEICQVLGCKLGAIVTEVLECVQGVIDADPAVEARRAAVSVMRQLFVGLGDETLAFLRDEIEDVHRTLRAIYDRDEDDVMRLHAQVALEELEANVQSSRRISQI